MRYLTSTVQRSKFAGIMVSLCLFLFLFVPGSALGQLSQQQIEEIQQQAIDEDWTFSVGENPATQYSLEQLCGLKEPPDWRENAVFDPMAEKILLPSAFDWRDSTTFPPARNQASCGACWAFGTIGPLECNIKLKDNVLVDLSEQWLVSCNQDGWSCDGGWWAHDYHQWKTDPCGGTGAVYEADFPYTATNGTCNCPYNHHYLIDGWAYVGNYWSIPSIDAMKQALLLYGPISVAIIANSAMQSYTGGVFNSCASGSVNHGVTLVGWDDSQGTAGVWIIRNSWGTGWGEEGGYMRIEYGCSSVGYGASYINYPGAKNIIFDYPDGVPTILQYGQVTSFEIIVSGVGGAIPIPNSGQLYYAINGGAPQNKNMTQLTTNHYQADLPVLSCGDRIVFYVSVDEMVDGPYYNPDPSSPFEAFAVGDSSLVFEDNFETDQGWMVTGSATAGIWERGIPAGLGDRGDPTTDFDGSGRCYLTGNTAGDSDIDGGTTILISPAFDLSGGEGLIHYAFWYSNAFGNAPNSDTFKVFISNNGGMNWTLIDKIGPVEEASGGWYEHTIWASDYITLTDQMVLNFNASDLGDGSVVEAAVDDIWVKMYTCGTPGPQITTFSLPEWTVEMPYSQQLQASGGTGTLTWSDKNGDLSGTGLSLSSTGLLSGTPTNTGTISFTAMVTDEESATGERALSVNINPHVQVTTSSLPEWTFGQAYNQALAAVGGTGTYSWSDKNNDLNGTGLSVAAEGNISGAPSTTGILNFTVAVTDACGDVGEMPLSVTINPAVSITTETLPDATEGSPYSCQLEMIGGTGNINWTDKNNDLDGTGLTLSSDGIISGTSPSVTTISLTAKAQDIAGSNDEQVLTLEVGPAWICGDADGSGGINILDITFVITFLYKGGPAPAVMQSADVDSSGAVNLLDVTRMIAYMYKGGSAPDCGS
ncbi:MAG: C1 family peptidase [Candidatus Zixiibacteriota bacterium]